MAAFFNNFLEVKCYSTLKCHKQLDASTIKLSISSEAVSKALKTYNRNTVKFLSLLCKKTILSKVPRK